MIETTPAIDMVLAKPLHAVVGINRAGKPPQLTVVWFDWDGTTFRFDTSSSRAKFRNLLKDSALSLLIDDPETNSYVVAYGRAEAEEGGHPELMHRLFERYLPGQDPGEGVHHPDRVVVALTPDRILSGS